MGFLIRHSGVAPGIALLILGMGLHLWGGFTPLHGLRLAWFDLYQRVLPRAQDASPVVIVAVDETSLKAVGQWPWPRSILAKLLHEISAAKAVAVGVDLLWPEPDRLSPEIWALSQPDLSAAQRQALLALPANDALLAASIKTVPVVLGVAGLDDHKPDRGPKTLVRVRGASPLPFLDHHPSILRTLPVIDQVAAGHGVVSVNKDGDGLVRTLPLVTAIGTEVMPSLGVEVLRLVKGAAWIDLSVGKDGIESVGIGDLIIPSAPSGKFWVHYTPHVPERFVSAVDVLSGKAADILEGRMVLLGVTGLGLTDYPVTSLHESMPGIEVHAQFLENIFSGQILQRPPWANRAEVALLGCLGLFLLLGIPRLSPLGGLALFLTLTTLTLGMGWWAYWQPLWLLDTATPGAGGSLLYLVLLGGSLTQARRQKRDLAKMVERERLAAAQMAIELEAAQRIRESEERVRLLLESVGEGVLGVDLAGQITFANPQASILLGCPGDALIGLNAHEKFHHSAADGTPYPLEACRWLKTMLDGVAYHIDHEVFWRMDGTHMDVEYRCTPVRHGEQMAGAVVSFSDITERKRIQHERNEAMNVISGSILYASRIQRSVLPDTAILDKTFSDYFVYWEPRDTVGGDIYWCDAWGNGILLLLGDCTGHGVPGAFMTLIAVGALRQAKAEVPEGDVAALIRRTHQLIQITLGQHLETGESDDGIELGICHVQTHKNLLIFAGARFDLFIVADNSVQIIKGNKKGIGYRGIDATQPYDVHELSLLPGSSCFMTTDGLLDQIGGTNRRAFGKNRFKELLLSLQHLPMTEQKEQIRQTLVTFQGEEKRRDDVSVIGFRFAEADWHAHGRASQASVCPRPGQPEPGGTGH
ncbi:MAG: CHASE2 domain-containing protein [Magnetococcus sp. DMHC-1]